MARRIDRFFSDTDREAIAAATVEAERLTAGELVVYIVERCDTYEEIVWKGVLVGGAVGATCAAIAVHFAGGWGAPDQLWLLFGLQLGLLGGWIASRFEGIARRLITNETLERRVQGRAAEAFLEEQVFATAARTGVLIFIALFEHRVSVIADDGIAERVPSNTWDEIASMIADATRSGAPAPAVIDAVGRCAALLDEHGVPPSISNELRDEPRFRDE